VVFFLLPGIVLGVLALRTLRQETLFAQQQIQQRLQSIADRTGRDLARDFRQWQEALSSIVGQKTAGLVPWPEMVRQAVASPGSGVVIWRDRQDFRAYPSSQLLYLPPTIPVGSIHPKLLPPSVAQVEDVELVQKDYTRAIHLYQGLLDSSGPELRPLILHRLARTFRKAGRLDDAARTYREMERSAPTHIGQLPSDLVARSELCSIAAERGSVGELAANVMALYRDLVRSRWLLEKPRYLYYSDRCRSWSKESPVAAEEFKRLEAVEEEKLALTGAVEAFLVAPKGVVRAAPRRHLAFWQRDPFVAIVLSGSFLELHWCPSVFSIAEEQDLVAVLYSPDGKPAFGSLPQETPSLAVRNNIQVGESQWQLQVWPRHPEVLYSDLKQRQTLYMGMLIFVVAFLVFGSYITARTLRRELEIARMRADFVSTVSHEFRSPLTGIRQLGEMLLDGRVRGEEKRHRYYEMIVQESKRLGRLVENTLDFSRMEEGRKEYRIARVDTPVWLQEVVNDFQSEVAGNGILITADIPEELPQISADGEALGCAVHNLLDNAVKYSPGSKTVWLNARAENSGIRISVQDRGVGISEWDRKHIFDKFFRAEGPISQKIKGAGIGLSLVKHIVMAHGGTVECESRVGEGSTFCIRLPAAPPAAGG
jgi:signal transduction histidine kinase